MGNAVCSAGSTWIFATFLTRWWGNAESPTIFFPFVAFWGGLAQFIAGIHAFWARDTLTLIVCSMWGKATYCVLPVMPGRYLIFEACPSTGSFWMSVGLLFLLVATGVLEPHSQYTHFPELASWYAVLTAFTWPAAICALARDLALFLTLLFLAIGSTIALGSYYQYGAALESAIKAAGYFFVLSSIAAWWRVTVYRESGWAPSLATSCLPSDVC